MTIVAFPVSREREDALCRKLFDAYTIKTRALRQRDWASMRRAQAIYDDTLQVLRAIGLDEPEAFRRGASA